MAVIINQPYIEDVENGKIRLCSQIEGEYSGVLYYEVEEKYREYLCCENADAFLVGLLHSCMYDNEEIICKAGVSSQLLFQLKTYYIPTLSENMPDMHSINIKAKATGEIMPVKNGVGTGNSGGVDSFYTMLKYNKANFSEFGLTHVIFNNISTNDFEEERIRALFERDSIEKRKVAQELGLEFIGLYTNLYAFYKQPGIFNHYFALQYASAIYALKKLFSVFYFSSTFQVNMFSISYKEIVSSARFDIFSLDSVSTRGLKFYSAGLEAERLDKMKYIVQDEIVKHHLQVCAIEQSAGGYQANEKLNCGHCHKCSRTIAIFYAWGELDDYEEIFDLTLFKKNKNKFIGRGLAADQGSFSKIVKKLLKEKKLYRISISFWYRLYKIRYGLARHNWIVKIYYKLTHKDKQ